MGQPKAAFKICVVCRVCVLDFYFETILDLTLKLQK